MQLDFNNVSKVEATIVIEADEQQKSCDIARVYETIVESGEFFTKVAEDLGMETAEISEILYLDKTDREVYPDKRGDVTAVASSGVINSFRISAVYSDAEKCKDMLESAVTFLEEKHSTLKSTLGEHEIIVAMNLLALSLIGKFQISKKRFLMILQV